VLVVSRPNATGSKFEKHPQMAGNRDCGDGLTDFEQPSDVRRRHSWSEVFLEEFDGNEQLASKQVCLTLSDRRNLAIWFACRRSITADAGGSNGSRLKLWKWELQRFSNHTGLTITVCHFPPWTSKSNHIEHRLFSHIAMNWRGTPLVNLATIVSLIGSTHSRSGLRVRSELDRGRYPGGVSVTDAQMATVRLEPHRFHGEWNYTIHPTTRRAH
jgi:hypothetical protein